MKLNKEDTEALLIGTIACIIILGAVLMTNLLAR